MAESPHRVVIAGAGVAGLEALIALHGIAGDRVATTVASPDREFFLQAHSVEEPFARPAVRRWSVDGICAAHGADHLRAPIAAVDAAAGVVTTPDGSELAFDSLLIAVGARRERPFESAAIVFGGDRDAEAMHGLIQDVEEGYAKRIAFVVPAGVTWPLPLYELALMTAQRAYEMGHEDMSISFVTPEELPMATFGQVAGRAVATALEEAGIELKSASYVRRIAGNTVFVEPDGELVNVDRVVTVPRLTGPGIGGVPADEDGFIITDPECRVRGTANVFAAGDGTVFPVKQGGLAGQQADVAANGIARRAGVELEPTRFEPVLRAKLLTGSRAKYLRGALGADGGEETSTAADHTLWWPPSKVAAPHLAAYLDAVEHGGPAPHVGEIRAPRMHPDPAGGIDLLEPRS